MKRITFVTISLFCMTLGITGCGDIKKEVPIEISIETEQGNDTEEISYDKIYDKINAYMEEESKKTFSPYYELLDFEMTNYQEEALNEGTEVIFDYKIIYKNYDKDPDTVGYIKEAKESGNSNYQQMYDEYLQPKEMNFYLKAVTDANDSITLYSNISPIGIEWEETKMSDFILSK